MARQTLLKSALCLLMALVCNVMWAQPAVSDAPTDGQWAANTTWFQIKNQKNKVIRADALTNEGYLSLGIETVTNGDAGLWCIVGDAENGYKFYNRAKGADVVLGMTGSEASAAAIFVAIGTEGYTTAFDIVASTDDGYWCVKEHGSTNNYWNQRDPRLAYWPHDNAQKGDDGSAFLFSPVDLSTVTGLATEDEVTAAQALIKVAPGYPKTTTNQYRVLDVIANSSTKGAIKTELDKAITAYKTCDDIILPEDGKAYTFTAVMGNAVDATKYYMKYVNGQKIAVSKTEGEASIFVCKELSTTNANEKKYAFITADGSILTWVGNNEGDAYKENNNIYGYSSHYAAEYNNLADWNEITIKKNGTNTNDLGYLRLVGRRKSDVFSPIIANKNDRFDQASDGYWFNDTNSSAWLLTEVAHENTEAQNLALAEINATHEAISVVEANATKLGENIGQAYYTINSAKETNIAAVKTAIYNATTADAINAIKASYKFNIPTAGAPYYLFDEKHEVYLDIHHLGAENAYPGVNQMATLSSEPQPLYITANPNDGSWKIHTTYKGGNYLCQYTGGKQTWDSWVSADASSFNWGVEVSIDGEELYYVLKNTGTAGGYLGCGEHSNGKVLYANQTNDADKLKLKLVEDKANILTINNLDTNGITYPHALTDEQAAKVFGQNSLTIAIDVTMPASLADNTRYALLCGADPTQAAATEATKTNSSYIAYGLNGNYPAYMPSSLGGDKFSYRKASFAVNETYKVVYVVDKINNKFLVYINGVLINMEGNENYPLSGYELQSFGNFSTADGDKLYIGGGAVSGNASYDKFGGTIHSVKFYNYALTAEEIAAIEYPVTDKQQDIIDRTHTAYRPTTRATTLESGKKYMIYNTAFNGDEDRTGFMYDNGSGIGHSGAPKKKPATFKNINEAYLWEIETTDEEGKYYLKAADGGYVNATGKTDNAEPVALYIQPWSTSKTTKAGVKSEAADATVTENANIGADVFTIGGTKEGNTGKDCWNGNPNTFSNWESAHPYAFYEVEESSVIRPVGSPTPGKTYYIYCANDTRQYFYNDGGTLKVSAERTEWSNEYLFTCSYDGKYFQFKNMKGKYLKHQGLQDAPYNFELATYLDGVNLKTPDGSYFVMKADGGFDQSTSGTYDPKETNFSTVYKFEEFNFPVDGETYYIYSDTYKDGGYVNRYLYNDGDQLKLNTSLTHNNAYVWTCIITQDGHVQFRNGDGKYLKHRGVQDTPYDFTVNKYNSTHAIAATLYSNADGGRYFAVKNDGTAFDQSKVTSNQTTGEWCTDFVFEPCLETKKALKLLIAETQDLANSCTNYYHIELPLQTTEENGDYYVSTNAQEDKEGSIANLVDGSNDNHFHSEYETDMGGKHYININLGSNNATKSFKFKYATRKAETNFPKTIEISGSNDGETFTSIATVTNLPVGNTSTNVLYESGIIESDVTYSQLRFTVTANNSGNKEAGNNPYFHMAEFDLMPRQAEPVSNYPNSVLVPSALTAAKEGVANAETTIESILTMDDYETSFATLKVVYDELAAAVANGNRPIRISLDLEKPYIYKIGSKRGDTKVLQLDFSGDPKQLVAVVDYDATNMEQAWYFTKGSDDEKVFIHPYMAEGNVLSASSTSNAKNAVWAAEKGAETHQEWIVQVVDNANGTYNIKAGNGSNYFSHNGGFDVTQYMGFWSNENTTDGGSLFTFTHVELKNFLGAYKETHCAKESYAVGEVPGYYQGGAAYNEARIKAVEVLTNEEATAEEYKNAYIALREAKNALKFLTPEDGKFYVLRCNHENRYIYTKADNKLYWTEDKLSADGRAVWQFEAVDTEGTFKMKSVHSGSYIPAITDKAHVAMTNAGADVIISSSPSVSGAVIFSTTEGDVGLHAHGTGNTVIGYTNGAGANHYFFEEVTAFSYTLTVGDAGYSTLYLGYPTTVPTITGEDNGVYVASEVASNYVALTQVEAGHVLPAKTGVIIKASKGDYTFTYSSEENNNVTSAFEGTLVNEIITPAANTTYYVLANGDNGVGLYKAKMNRYGDGSKVPTDKKDGTRFLNNANKVYLPVVNDDADDEPAAEALVMRFGRGQGTTEIENMETTDNGQQTTVIYDLTGRRIEKIVEKGMYIINGKKVVIR